MNHVIAELSNIELLSCIEKLSRAEQETTLTLLLHLGELDTRRLYLGEGYSSLFAYCTGNLKYSEPAANRRIRSARCIKEHPEIVNLLRNREVNLTTLSLLSAVITPLNKGELLELVKGKSRSEVEIILSRFKPACVVRELIKPVIVKDAQKTEILNKEPLFFQSSSAIASLSSPPIKSPLIFESPPSYRIQFEGGPEFMKKLKRIRELLPGQSLEGVFEIAISEYLKRRTPEVRAAKRIATQKRTALRPAGDRTRHIPLALRDSVLTQSNCQCSYVSSNGVRCTARTGLQIDHILPYAKGGASEAKNLRVLCAAHNRHQAELHFGREHMAKFQNDLFQVES